MRRILLVFVGTAIIVAAVFAFTDSRETLAPLPEGVQQIEGYLKRSELSRVRRGTHSIRVGSGTITAYLESAQVNLRPLEESVVVLEGVYERNIDPSDPPVFVVQKFVSGGPVTLRRVNLALAGVSIEVPETWDMSEAAGEVQFLPLGATGSVLSVASVPLDQVPFDFKTFVAKPGTGITALPLVVADEVAGLAWAEASQELGVYVRFGSGKVAAGPGVVRLRFPQAEWGPGVKDGSVVDRVLQTLRPTYSASSSSRRSVTGGVTGSGAAKAGQPCGGPAGVLCGAGSYCDVSADPKSGIGVCRAF